MTSNEQFRYWDPGWWENYFKNDLYSLYRSLHCLNKYKDLMINEIESSSDLRGLLSKNYEFWIKVFMGGVDEKCVKKGQITYSCIPDNSLATFFRKVLNIQLSEDDMNKYVARVMSYVDAKEAGKGINPSYNRDDRVGRDLYENLKELFKLIGMSEPECNVELRDPIDAINLYIEYINNIRRILPLYNDVSFFIQSVHSTPRFYIEQVYGGEIFSDKVRQILQNYGIKLRVLMEAPKGLEVYDVIGYEPNSVGEIVTHVLIKAWNYANPIVPIAKGPSIRYNDYVKIYFNDVNNDIVNYLGKKYYLTCDSDINNIDYAIVKIDSGMLERVNDHQVRVAMPCIGYQLIPYILFVIAFAKAMFTGLVLIDESEEKGKYTISRSAIYKHG